MENKKFRLQIGSVLMEHEFYKAVEDMEEFLESKGANKSMVIQSLSLSKEVFLSKAEALEWAGTHNFTIYEDDNETKTDYVLIQLNEAEFIESTFKVIEISRGVMAKIGDLRVESDQITFLSLRNKGNIKLDEKLPHIIELAKVVKGYHAAYGIVELTEDTLKSFEKNFNNGVLGVDVSIDYNHETSEAAGWIRDVFIDYQGQVLFGVVKWTPKGALSLSDREFRYFSPMFVDNYIHPHTGVEYGPTLTGGALVNHPFLKMDAIVSLKDKKGNNKVDTIKLSEHNEKVAELNSEIATYKLSEEQVKNIVKSLKEENEKIAKELSDIKEDNIKKEKEARFQKLFDDNKICKAQLDALKEGKDLHEVLELAEKMNITAVGKSGDNNESMLSDEEKSFCKKLNITEEDYIKYNPKK